MKNPIVVIFCIPGNRFSDNFLKSWTLLHGWCLSHNITPHLSNSYDSNVYYARNKCLGPDVTRGKNQKPWNNEVRYDYIMWIDSDMVFSPQNFEALLKMEKPIASGIYKMSDGVNYATVEHWDKAQYEKNGSFQFLNDKIIADKESIFPVEYTGFGWVLIKKGVFESMQYPWFRPEWDTFRNGEIEEFCSEDVGFCQNAIKKGYKIHINTDIRIGHEKSLIL